MGNVIRHGDVKIEQVETIPKSKKINKIVLAEGEVTGHFHVLQGELAFAEQDNDKYFEVLSESAKLSHEEHDTLQIPKGKYKYLIQREVDLAGEIRQVMD